jgi:hypothetical protein
VRTQDFASAGNRVRSSCGCGAAPDSQTRKSSGGRSTAGFAGSAKAETSRRRWRHVGIYVGNGRFIHAPHTGSSVRVQELSAAWYGKNYVGAVRFAR